MKGIILAGGSGTRLYPLTKFTSKQLLPVYDKPMIYYPLSTLMLAGIREIAIISTPRDLPQYENLLGDGKKWGINIQYFQQDKPRGLADAFLICKNFIANDSVSLILGDNIFYGNMQTEKIFSSFEAGALIFGYPVKDPQRYGIIEFNSDGKVVNLEEKPSFPKSRYAVPGLYVYDSRVTKFAEGLQPSERGELEITDLNKIYLSNDELEVILLGRGIAWLDTGTSESLQEASSFVMSVEKRQSYKIGCPEEISLRKKYIDIDDFKSLIQNMDNCEYSEYLKSVFNEFQENSGIKEKGIYDLQL